MAVVSIQAKMTTDDLIAALDQLDPAESDKVVRQLLQKQARRRSPNLPAREAELFREIYREPRPGFRERFDVLNQKCTAFTLTPEEHEELLRLVDESEAYAVRRVEALGELSQLRGSTLPALMKQLGLKSPAVV